MQRSSRLNRSVVLIHGRDHNRHFYPHSMLKSDQISLDPCVQAPVLSKIYQIWKIYYAVAKSTVRYTGHFFINYLSEGELTGPLSFFKLATWHGKTLHRCDATPHHSEPKCWHEAPQHIKLRKHPMACAKLSSYLAFFFKCRLLTSAMPPFNYTRHLHFLNYLY